MNMQLRPARLADLEQIAAHEAALFGADAWSENLVRDELTGEYRDYFVLCDAANTERVQGYAGVLTVGSEADVQTIAVVPELRGRGYGRQLLAALGEAAHNKRAKQLFLEVRADNQGAIKLYAAAGFTQIAVRPNYYQPDGVDALIMRANLPLRWQETHHEAN